MIQRGFDGSVIREVVISEGVTSHSKTLYVIGGNESVFDRSVSPIFEIEADQDIGVIALQGDLEGSQYLWFNPVRVKN